MSFCFGCTSGRFGSPVFATLSKAAAKSAAARLRGAGVLRTAGPWAARLDVCRGCPLRTVSAGIPHCGKPLLRQLARPADAGCGCPLEAKAKSPGEHCPLTVAGRPSRGGANVGGSEGVVCDCKWCAAEAASHARRRGTAPAR